MLYDETDGYITYIKIGFFRKNRRKLYLVYIKKRT